MKPSDATCKIIETLNLFNINFNNNENKFLSLASVCRNGVAVLSKFDANGASILTLFWMEFFGAARGWGERGQNVAQP